MMTPVVAGLRIGQKLRALEEGLDRLLIDTADLTMTLGQARLDLDQSIGSSQLPLVRMTKAQEAFVVARGEVARVHAMLEQLARERGDIPTEPKPSGALGDPLEDQLEAA